MMAIFFDPVGIAFYDDQLSVPVPLGSKPITAETHKAMLLGVSQGKLIVANSDGSPILQDAPLPSHDEIMANLRRERDRLLTQCDWTQMPDAPLNEAQREAWRAYRQQLRDLPETITDPADILWPEPPTGESH